MDIKRKVLSFLEGQDLVNATTADMSVTDKSFWREQYARLLAWDTIASEFPDLKEETPENWQKAYIYRMRVQQYNKLVLTSNVIDRVKEEREAFINGKYHIPEYDEFETDYKCDMQDETHNAKLSALDKQMEELEEDSKEYKALHKEWKKICKSYENFDLYRCLSLVRKPVKKELPISDINTDDEYFNYVVEKRSKENSYLALSYIGKFTEEDNTVVTPKRITICMDIHTKENVIGDRKYTFTSEKDGYTRTELFALFREAYLDYQKEGLKHWKRVQLKYYFDHLSNEPINILVSSIYYKNGLYNMDRAR